MWNCHSYNLTNKFRSLHVSVTKTSKSFISGKYNSWLSNEVPKQLRAEKAHANVKVSLKLSIIKPLYAKWIIDLYNTLKDDKKMAINGFRSAGISEAIENAKDMEKKLSTLSRKFDCKTFFYKYMKRRHDSFFFSF